MSSLCGAVQARGLRLSACALIVVALRDPEKVRPAVTSLSSAVLLNKYGRLPGGQALQSGICQKRPRVVQEMQGKHSERLAENGHHGAGNVATSGVSPSGRNLLR